MGSQPAGHVGVGGLAEVQSSGTEVEFDAVAWRLEADVAADADGLGAAEFADDVGEFGGWVEFSVEGAEPAGGFGVVSRPGVPCSAGGVEFVSLILEPADGLVEAPRFGGNGPAVGGFGGRFGIGPALCLFSPVPPVSPACEGVGVVLGVAVSVAGDGEATGGVTFGRTRVAALAGDKAAPVPVELSQLAVEASEFGGGVGWDGGGDGSPFGLEAGVADRPRPGRRPPRLRTPAPVRANGLRDPS